MRPVILPLSSSIRRPPNPEPTHGPDALVSTLAVRDIDDDDGDDDDDDRCEHWCEGEDDDHGRDRDNDRNEDDDEAADERENGTMTGARGCQPLSR